MANPPRSMERQSHPEHPPPHLVSDRDRCVEGRVGTSLSRSENRRPVVSDGKEAPHKCLELLAGSFAFTKNRLCAHVRLRMDNTIAVAYVNRLGDTHSLVLSKEQHHAQSRTLSGPPQHGSRLGVSSFPECQQLAPRPEGVQFPDANSGPLCDRPACRQIEPSASAILQLETRSSVHSNRCSNAGLVSRPELCLPALLSDHALPSQTTGDGRGVDLDHASLATQAWYPRLLDMSVASPVVLPSFPDLLLPAERKTPVTGGRDLVVSRRAFLQTLPDSFWQRGGQAQAQFITPPGKNDIAGVTAGNLIHFAPLCLI